RAPETRQHAAELGHRVPAQRLEDAQRCGWHGGPAGWRQRWVTIRRHFGGECARAEWPGSESLIRSVLSVTASADPQSNQALSQLDQRKSVPARQLGEPAPDDATLLRMLQSAVRVPDHGKRVPFRFVRIRGDARHALGDALASRVLQGDPAASESTLEKD